MRRANGEKPKTPKKKVVKKSAGKKKTPEELRKIISIPKPALVDFEPPMDVREPDKGGRPPLTDDNLTDAHIHFCRRYAIHSNGEKAAKEAGYNAHYPAWALKQPPLMKLIARFREQRRKKFELSADKVIAELVKVAFGNLDDFTEVQRDGTPIIDCSNVGREEMAALQSIEQDVYYEKVPADGEFTATPVKRTKIKLYDKLRALEMLGRNLGLFSKDDLDKLSPEEKAAAIKNALKAMAKADGE